MTDVRNLVVQDDTRKDIGLVTVTGDSQQTHWVTLPDGSIRSSYFSRKVADLDFDTLDAFESLPRLKVSYRPISKFLFDYSVISSYLMIAFRMATLIFGILVGIATFQGTVLPALSHPSGFWTATILGLGTPVATANFFMFHLIGTNRYTEYNESDRIGTAKMHAVMREEEKQAEDERMEKQIGRASCRERV